MVHGRRDPGGARHGLRGKSSAAAAAAARNHVAWAKSIFHHGFVAVVGFSPIGVDIAGGDSVVRQHKRLARAHAEVGCSCDEQHRRHQDAASTGHLVFPRRVSSRVFVLVSFLLLRQYRRICKNRFI